MLIDRETEGRVEIIGTGADTYDFAHYNPAGTWPASALSGEYVRVILDTRTGDLIDGEIPEDCLSEELAAFIDFAYAREGK